MNLDLEFKRNRERYEFLKWGQQAFETFGVVPPGIGIVHQVNLEYLAKGVLEIRTAVSLFYPDTLVGTDSHTTMINGLGVVGWGVGGIEAEAGMLGQPVYFLTPEVVGVHLTGALKEGVTATDLVLHVTQMLRKAKVVGKFVEFYGPGAKSLPVVDRATIANMAPEYGATMGFFGVDEETRRLPARHRPQRRTVRDLRELLQGAGSVGHSAERARSTTASISNSTSPPCTRRRRTEAPAGPHRPAGAEAKPSQRSSRSPSPTAATASPPRIMREGGRPHQRQPAATVARDVFHGRRRRESHAEGAPKNVAEMVTNRPTPDAASDLSRRLTRRRT